MIAIRQKAVGSRLGAQVGKRGAGNLLVVVAVGLGVLALAVAEPAAGYAEPLGHAGRWITDARGRVVVIHGTTVVTDPAVGTPETLPGRRGFGRDDARFLARHGINAVRLGMFYTSVEPQPGVYDEGYVRHYVGLQRKLARAGVLTLLDMHHDQFATRYAGRGFPDWMAIDDGLPNPATPYPAGYLTNPALNRAYDNFWANLQAGDGLGLQDHFAEGWRRIAARFSKASHLLGYDLLNEPWPGTLWPACANTAGCPPGGFDQTELTQFHERVLVQLRRADRRHLAFYEPNLQFDFGAATGHGRVADPGAGFSFHIYCLGAMPGMPLPDPLELCGLNEQIVVENAVAHSEQTGAALLNTEFGATFETRIVRRVIRILDASRIGWMHWHYWDLIRDPLKRAGRAGNVNGPMLDAVSIPYPRLIAGTPESYGFDRQRRRFELSFTIDRADGAGRFPARSSSVVFVPTRPFRDGYRVEATGARVISSPRAKRLRIESCPGADRVHVVVDPGSGRSQGCRKERGDAQA